MDIPAFDLTLAEKIKERQKEFGRTNGHRRVAAPQWPRLSIYIASIFKLTKEYHITPSISRRGNPYDNALAENFFSILKTEIYRTKPQPYEQALILIDEYIYFYSNQRIKLKTKPTPLELRSQYVD